MAKKLAGDLVVTLLAVSFGAGYGWTGHGSTECQPSGSLAIDTTLQSDVQLLQTIAGQPPRIAGQSDVNASMQYYQFEIGVNIAQAAGGSDVIATRKQEAENMIQHMIPVANTRVQAVLFSSYAFPPGEARIMNAGGAPVVYVFIQAMCFGASWQSVQGALESLLLTDFQTLTGWSEGYPYSVTLGESGSETISNSALNTGNAVGDPHLQNLHGERFDLMQPGEHVLVHIPRRESFENTLLHVQAVAQNVGGLCTDTYFTRINVTGKWPSALRPGGFIFLADDPDSGAQSKWMNFHGLSNGLQIKVVHGRTQQGVRYLNFYIKHLDRVGFPIGGLLGEDDHEEASTPPRACEQRMALRVATVSP
jgi:hypothetical protein